MIENVAQQLMNDFASPLALDMQAAERVPLPQRNPPRFAWSLVARAWWQSFVDRLRALSASSPKRVCVRAGLRQQLVQPIRPDRRFADLDPERRQRILDRRDDRRRGWIVPASPAPLDPEWVERRRRFQMHACYRRRRSRSAADNPERRGQRWPPAS
jgi:hypothetical protein